MDVTTIPNLFVSESGKWSAKYEFALRQEMY
jgi:hypothetical protein